MRLAVVLCLLPLPALAELSDPIGAALGACVANGPSLEDRAGALTAMGWEILPAADRPAAAQALAPFQLVRIGRLSEDDMPVRRAELLLQAAEGLLYMINRENSASVWLKLPDGEGFLTLQSRIPEIVECQLAADLSPDLIATFLNAPIERQDHPPVTFTYFMTVEDRFDAPVLMTFAPDTFGSLHILPILATPRAASN